MFKQGIFLIVGLLYVVVAQAQQIEMEFPAFAGKTYDFIIFQGSKAEKVMQDTIPASGKFTLTVPPQYAPYTGMCRWLITNSAEGGGLDMAIPGQDFSVSCLSATPNQENMVYKGFDAVNEINRLFGEQQRIIDKFETMSKAATLYGKNHTLYATFEAEQAKQREDFDNFRLALRQDASFNARFLPIVSLTKGIAHHLSHDDSQKALLVNEFITQEMSIEDLYVSGHWQGIIQSWVLLQMNVINDKSKFAADFKKISDRITKPVQYTDFVGKMTYYLNTYGKDDYIQAIAHTVVSSGKVTSYVGATMQVYQKQMIGMQAPDLVLPDGKNLNSQDLAKGGYEQTLLLFFDTGCGHCEEVIKQLQSQYNDLQAKKVRIMTFAADADEAAYKKAIAAYPWQDNYCDFKSMAGVNFINYVVPGTPTLFLLDKKGVILKKSAKLSELFNVEQETVTGSKNSK